jgi:hypothetical protein
MNAIAKTVEAAPAAANTAMTPMEMLSSAIDKGATVEMIDKLMTLQERWEASQGRKAFDDAIAKVRGDERFRPVGRNRAGHNNKRYADFEAYAKMLDPILADNGLSYRFETDQDGGQIRVTCVVAHRDGHSTRNTLAAAADTSGNKNSIQAVGSTLTYLQRYTLVQAFGLAATDDDDGRAAGGGVISDAQYDALLKEAERVKANLPLFEKAMGVETLADLPVSKFDTAMARLTIKGQKDAANV